MVLYAGVIIDISHASVDRIFQYRIPDSMTGVIHPGSGVYVPFGRGNHTRKGYVVSISTRADYDASKIKEIIRPDLQGTDVNSDLIALAFWMRQQYGGTMNQALKTVLPVKKKTAARKERRLHLLLDETRAQECLQEFQTRHQSARARLLEALIRHPVLSYRTATHDLKVTASVIQSLEEKNILAVESIRQFHSPLKETDGPAYRIRLNEVQQQTADEIRNRADRNDLRPSLIHGVTGSGKTEVYMELIASVIEKGKQAIVLIPEIALTYQTVTRFCGRFEGRVSVLNSRMSAGERYDQFARARNGEIDVMIGPRSALFTPFSDLGCIIIDEEHENSYKSENIPRYDARETAICRARMCQAFVVLGSATPSVESYQKALNGEYVLYEMKHRVSRRPLPGVRIADMRRELREGNRSVLSRTLRELIEQRLADREQIMLFLNRRGMAGFVSCRSCGHVIRCPHCDVSLSLHGRNTLVCHYCGYRQPMVRTCPECGSPYIGTFRAGTQRIEQYIKKEFPQAAVLRMDSDTTRKKGSYEKILRSFRRHEADILIGTQMIVKGHDFPGVTLVGALAADLSLAVPDYRAAERTFQLLTQAAGRAGRGERPGEMVIQTYQPDHYSIVAAARQDYASFYRKEMAFRRMMHYPPAWEMLLLHIDSTSEEDAGEAAEALKNSVLVYYRREDARRWQLIGPADASVARVRDIFKKVIYIKHADAQRLRDLKGFLEKIIKQQVVFQKVSVLFDFNPAEGF